MATYQNYTTLQLNHRIYNKEELQELIAKKLAREETADWEKSLFQFIKVWLSDVDFVEVQTSGSTGTPKKIRLKKEYMVNSAKATGSFFNLKNKVALLCLPCDYIAGKMMVVRSFVLKMNLLCTAPSSNPLKNNAIGKIDFGAMIPMQVAESIKHRQLAINQMTTLIIGGGAVDAVLMRQLQALKTNCYATYGMTETITHIAIKKLNHTSEEALYQAIEGVRFTKDNRGCLVIDAPHVADELVVTNDLIDLKNEVTFEWLGRYDNVINTGGVKVSPEIVEKKLATLIKGRFFIAALPDERLGQQVILIVEVGGNNDVDRKDLMAKCKETLKKYEMPKQILGIGQFSETATKKIQRQQTIQRVLAFQK